MGMLRAMAGAQRSKTVSDDLQTDAGQPAIPLLSASNGSVLPWVCPKHPNAQIRHSWDEKHHVLNGEPEGRGMRFNHRYECAECMTQLAAPNDKLSDRREKNP